MIARVFGVTALRMRLRVHREAVLRGRSATSTGVASASFTCSMSVGQHGRVRDHLVAGAEEHHRDVVERLLAAGA